MKISDFVKIFIIFLSVSCEKPISRTEGEPFIEEREVLCTHAGICMTCLPGFDGKFSCGVEFSPMCQGRKKSLVKVTPIIKKYKNGEEVQAEEIEWVKDLTECN